MPHIIVEYSSNLESEIDIRAMLHDMHNALGEGLGSVERIKTRGIKLDHAVIGDYEGDASMIHISLLLLEGRDTKTKKAYAEPLYNIANGYVSATSIPYKISLEVRDMDKETYIL